MVQYRIGLCASMSLALACQGILGIRELNEDPRPLSSDAGSGGSAGNLAGAGGSPDAVASAGSGASPASSGGTDGLSVEPVADAGTPSGSDAGGPVVVAGRVIDFFRRPVPGVPVTIGDTTVATDALGAFSISGIEPPYTASLVVTPSRGGGLAHYGYIYEGLTRTDPTLQVYSALPERSASSLAVSFQNVDFIEGRSVILGLSSPDGRFVSSETTGNTEFLGSPEWTGPTTLGGNLHALVAWRDTAFDPPVWYEAHQSVPLVATDAQRATADFDLGVLDVTTGSVSGVVTGGLFDPRSNFVAMRLSDGTTLPLVDATSTGIAFSYFVPNLEGSSFVLAAGDGSSGFPPYAVRHVENIASGQADVVLALPRPVTLNTPQFGAPVTPSTPYSWSTLGQTAQTFLWHLEFNATYEGLFVLTNRTQIELPTLADGFTVPEGVAVSWSVETHGDAPDVDALTGPDGYLDSFSVSRTYPVGPNRNGGYYTETERRSFTMGAE